MLMYWLLSAILKPLCLSMPLGQNRRPTEVVISFKINSSFCLIDQTVLEPCRSP